MKLRSALLLSAVLTLIGALFACTANGGSIYATIETEQKVVASTLEQTITVLDIVKVASAPLPYFVAAGAVYHGALPDANNVIGWPTVDRDPVPVTPPAKGALCLALTYFDNGVPADRGLYGGFFADGPGMGLYKADPVSPSFATPIAAMSGKQITLLCSDATNLFAVVATLGTSGFTYSLEFSADGVNFFPATSPTAVPLAGLARITGVAFFNGNYYVTSGTTLYAGATPTSLSPVASIPNGGTDVLEGLTADATYLFVPSDNGTVFYTTDGTTWSIAGTRDEINGHRIVFLTVSTQVGTSGPTYLVGADGAGFYYLNAGTAALSRFSDVTVTGLYGGSVRRIFVDPPQSNTVFMGAAGTGLWRTNFDPATGKVISTWIHE